MKSRSKLNILIIGHGRHGKDTAAAFLSEIYGLSFVASSEFAARRAVFPLVSDLYATWQDCHADRTRHRSLWFHAIAAYSARPGPSLAAQALQDHDIYVGMRRRAEFDQARDLFDLVIWVDALRRLPSEPGVSMELTEVDADLTLDNNGNLGDLRMHIKRRFEQYKLHQKRTSGEPNARILHRKVVQSGETRWNVVECQ